MFPNLWHRVPSVNMLSTCKWVVDQQLSRSPGPATIYSHIDNVAALPCFYRQQTDITISMLYMFCFAKDLQHLQYFLRHKFLALSESMCSIFLSHKKAGNIACSDIVQHLREMVTRGAKELGGAVAIEDEVGRVVSLAPLSQQVTQQSLEKVLCSYGMHNQGTLLKIWHACPCHQPCPFLPF